MTDEHTQREEADEFILSDQVAMLIADRAILRRRWAEIETYHDKEGVMRNADGTRSVFDDVDEEGDPMPLSEYRKLSRRTRNNNASTANEKRANYALGLAGEVGEIVELVKKEIFHKKKASRETITDELGDLFWYLDALADEYGIELSDILRRNVEKLKRRYPNGFVEGGGER